MGSARLEIWYLPFSSLTLDEESAFVLSKEEKAKAETFLHVQDRERYLLSHYYLRKALTCYYPSVTEKEWSFTVNAYGKPLIANDLNEKVYFNLSHSKQFLALICSSEMYCGIDVEEDRNIEMTEGMCEFLFSKEELQEYLLLDEKEKTVMFYTYWTVKEAHLKAKGTGLLEEKANVLNFSEKILLSQSKNTFNHTCHTSSGDSKGQYWSEQKESESFLAFCVLKSDTLLQPKYNFTFKGLD